MFRNTYDSDNTVFSPQGRLHQVEYALEAVKQGSAVVGLRSKTHAVFLALKRSPNELASYQKKILRIDDHCGVAIAGLTSDARVLSNFMRQQAMSSRMLFNRPIPVNRLVSSIAEKAQDQSGPHLYEFSPSGNSYEYYAMSIGARSQSAKTYLEKHYESFTDASLDELIKHGLHAQHEKNVRSDGSFRIQEGEPIQPWISSMVPKEEPAAPAEEAADAPAGGEDVVMGE
ncbi:20S proteasome subunit [Ceratobasidium sp. AG-Ba]|nr:20S proteasome subunit [Ceratobasidium sp. AG-Ba]